MSELKDVNPESIKSSDYISTRYGVGRVILVDEDRGYLSYEPLNREYKEEDVPIRSVRLLGSPEDSKQLSFAFIEEEIEAAIAQRNLRLAKLDLDIKTGTVRKGKVTPRTAKKKKTISAEDKAIMDMLGKLSAEDIKTLGLK